MYMLNIKSKYLEAHITQLAKDIHRSLFFPCHTEFFSSVHKTGCNLFLEYQGESFLEIYNLDSDQPRVDIYFSFSHLLPEVVGEMQKVFYNLDRSCEVYSL